MLAGKPPTHFGRRPLSWMNWLVYSAVKNKCSGGFYLALDFATLFLPFVAGVIYLVRKFISNVGRWSGYTELGRKCQSSHAMLPSPGPAQPHTPKK